MSVLLLCCVLMLAGCGTRSKAPSPVPAPAGGGFSGPTGNIADLRKFPQDLLVYARQGNPDRPLVSATEQARQDARFNRLFFGPWTATRAMVSASDAFGIFGGQYSRSKPRGWAENLLPWTPDNWEKLVTNAARESYPSRLDKAITVRPTVLREAPTFKPRFRNPRDAGEGYPFDMFMYSALPVGFPLLVTHSSADGAWVYVETGLLSGWVPTADTAVTDDAFRSRYENGNYAVFLRDDVPLRGSLGQYLSTAHVGTMLPIQDSGAVMTVMLPVRDPQGKAVIVAVRVSASDAVRKPLPLTAGAVAKLGNVMLGQPYGWGGYLGNRDCSLALRELFIPFGLWLPRNSAAQAKAWSYVGFAGSSPSAKERMIIDEGVPFATLLWLQGHITLYVGTYKGQAVMFHDMWGIRTDENGREGRHVVGSVVVTGLKPGAELSNADPEGLILSRLRGMSILM